MLAGAAAVDDHFRDAEGRANLPLLAAFADQYYTRLRGCQTRAVFAYDERLRCCPITSSSWKWNRTARA
jgi:glucose-6-phosphate isomerase